MPSSFTTNLNLELMVTGENLGTWSDKANANLNLLDAIFNTAGAGASGLRITGNGRFDGNLSLGVATALTRFHADLDATTVYGGSVPALADAAALLRNQISGGNIQSGLIFNVNSGGFDRRGYIGGISESASDRKLSLVFATDNGSGRTEKMRLTGDGELGIGTSSPDVRVQIEGGTDITLAGKTGFLAIGDADAQHIALDDDEIQSKSNGTTAADLFINALGGDVGIGIGTIATGVRLHVAEAVDDGQAILALENSQANAVSSTAEAASFQGRLGGVIASLIKTGKEDDFTSAAKEDSFLAFHTRLNGTLSEAARFESTGNLDLFRIANVRVVDGVKFTTIQAALNDLGSNGMVFVPAGTYAEAVTIPGDNITLFGAAKTAVQITPASGAASAISASAVRNNFRMMNISITIHASSSGQIGIDCTNFNFSLFEHIDIVAGSATSPNGIFGTRTATTTPKYNLFSQISMSGSNGIGINFEHSVTNSGGPNANTILGGRVTSFPTGIKLDGQGNRVFGTTIESVAGNHIDFGTATAGSSVSNVVVGTYHEGTAAGTAANFASGSSSNIYISGRVTSISATKYSDSGTSNLVYISDGGQTQKVPFRLNFTGDRVGFYNTTPVVKPTVTGSRGGNAALASLLTALSGQGLLTDSSS